MRIIPPWCWPIVESPATAGRGGRHIIITSLPLSPLITRSTHASPTISYTPSLPNVTYVWLAIRYRFSPQRRWRSEKVSAVDIDVVDDYYRLLMLLLIMRIRCVLWRSGKASRGWRGVMTGWVFAGPSLRVQISSACRPNLRRWARVDGKLLRMTHFVAVGCLAPTTESDICELLLMRLILCVSCDDGFGTQGDHQRCFIRSVWVNKRWGLFVLLLAMKYFTLPKQSSL